MGGGRKRFKVYMMTKEEKLALQQAAIENRDERRTALLDEAMSVPMVRDYVSMHSGQAVKKAFVQKIVVKEYEAA